MKTSKLELENYRNRENLSVKIRKPASTAIAKDKLKQDIAKKYLWMKRAYQNLI